MLMKSYRTDNVAQTPPSPSRGCVLSHRQDRPSRGGGTAGYSREGVALGVLNIDSKPHEASWHQVKFGQENLMTMNVLWVGDINVQHQQWLSSSTTYRAGPVLKDIAARLGPRQV
eukprot:g28537.t1